MIYVLHYHDDTVTNRCLASLKGQGPIVVIDDGSPTPFVPERKDVTLMRLEENLPLIPAFNVGMAAHPDDWYLCLNNDTLAEPGMVRQLLSAFDDPDVGIVAPGTSDKDAGALYVPKPGAWPNVQMRDVDNHAWCFTQDVIDEIGYPDADGHPHWANWYANRLYCWKARQVGYKVLGIRSAYITHIHAGGYNAEADQAGLVWITKRLGDRVREVL